MGSAVKSSPAGGARDDGHGGTLSLFDISDVPGTLAAPSSDEVAVAFNGFLLTSPVDLAPPRLLVRSL